MIYINSIMFLTYYLGQMVPAGRGMPSKPPPPGAGPLGGSGAPAAGLADMDPEAVPANMKVEGPDWFAL